MNEAAAVQVNALNCYETFFNNCSTFGALFAFVNLWKTQFLIKQGESILFLIWRITTHQKRWKGFVEFLGGVEIN